MALDALCDLGVRLRSACAGLPPEERPSLIAQVKAALQEGQSLLARAHREGAGGLALVRGRAGFMDSVLGALWGFAERSPREGVPRPPCALVAVGGYGRGELSPASDVDLLFAFSRRSALLEAWVTRVLYLLWDAGLDIGYSARTHAECVKMSRADFQSETSMFDHRLVAGEEEVHRELEERLAEHLRASGRRAYLNRRLRERNERYQLWDPSVYVQEPNVKESAGGLRDFHVVLWAARALFGARDLEGVVREGLLSPGEAEEAREAYDFLLRVRNELHLRARAKREVLTFDAQAEVAPALGYRDEENATAGEQLMRQYFLRARTLFQTSRRFLDACQERLGDGRGRRARRERLRGGLVLVNYNTLSLDGEGLGVLEEPAGLMRVFESQQRFGCELGRDAKEFVRKNLGRVDDAFRSSAQVRDSFLNILREHSAVARTLRSMHELGFLGRYIPEFEGLTCFVQYDHYHRYTADEHTLLTQAKLDELAATKELPLQEFARIFKELERPHLLRLALLLHDLGKARGSRHVHRSAVMVPPIVIRMGLPADEGHLVEFLISHHIAMSHTAERRDLEDPKLIREFAAGVGNVEQLNMLYLLTYADISAVAPGMWNEWRQALLHELYWKARRELTERGEARWLKVREEVRTRVLYEMRAGGVRAEEAEVDAHLRLMPEKYLSTTPPQDILRHILMARRLRTEPLALEVSHRRQMGNTQVTICCPDRLGLFAMFAGNFAAHELSILETQVYTRGDGVALDTFQVVGPEGGAVTEGALWEGVEARLRDLLAGRLTTEELVVGRRDFLRPKWRVHFEVPTVVEYDNAISDRYTVVDIFTADRHGLLYQIARTLSEEGVNIVLAKISTEGVRAIDVFYVTDAEGNKITDRERLERLREVLLRRLAPEPALEARGH